MEVYLIRHTETVIEKGICYGQSDVAIREPFIELFVQIANQLPDDAILYTSTLKRCLQLSNYIKYTKNYQNLIQDERLLEMNFGNWELQPWNEINEEELNPWMKDFVTIKVPRGENFQELHNRVLHFIETEIRKLKNSKPIVIVAHAGIVRSFLCHYQNLPLKDAFQNKVDFGQVIKIEI